MLTHLCLRMALQWLDPTGVPIVKFDKTKRSNIRPIVYYNCYDAKCTVVGSLNVSIDPSTGQRHRMAFNTTEMVWFLKWLGVNSLQKPE